VPRLLAEAGDRSFFVLLHLFDLHESKMLIPSLDAARARDLPRDIAAAARRKNFHIGGLIHDIVLADVDRQVRRLLSVFRRSGALENTIFFITADHGVATQVPQRSVGSDLSKMFFDEYVKVPLIINGRGVARETVGALMSHLDLGPTILEFAGLPQNTAFKGLPLSHRKTRPASHLMFENTGKGRCDIERKTAYIGVRTHTLKVVYECTDLEPRERDVYDLAGDPGETRNLRDTSWNLTGRAEALDVVRQRLRSLGATTRTVGIAKPLTAP
jgi:arylsulfatase A-like enzyme